MGTFIAITLLVMLLAAFGFILLWMVALVINLFAQPTPEQSAEIEQLLAQPDSTP